MTMTVRRSDRRRLPQISKRGRYVRQKSARRRSANTPKHENASLARQQPQKSRVAIRRASLHVGKDEVVVEETVSQDRATSSHLHAQQHLAADSCSSRRIRQSLVPFTYKGEKKGTVDQAVDQEHPAYKRSLFGNLAGLQEEVVVVSRVEAAMLILLVRLEQLKLGAYCRKQSSFAMLQHRG